jgi:hypothetical protein
MIRNRPRIFLRVHLSLLFTFSMAATIFGQDEAPSGPLSSAPPLPSLEDIKSCMKAQSDECFDKLFRDDLT